VGTRPWGLGYRLRDEDGLVLLSSGTTQPGDDSDRLWPLIFTRDRQRNKLVEQAVSRSEDVSLFLEYQRLEKEEILCVREKHLNRLLSMLENRSIETAVADRPVLGTAQVGSNLREQFEPLYNREMQGDHS
jgi:hypothetical protein